MTQHINWIKSDGGPLICILASAAHQWRGTERGVGSGDNENGATDYERACSILGYLGLVQLTDGVAIVLGDMPMATSILKLKTSEICILRVMYASSNEEVISYVECCNGTQGKLEEDAILNFESDGSGIVLFDSAYSGTEERLEAISYPLASGNYRVDTRLVDLQDHASFVLHRIERV